MGGLHWERVPAIRRLVGRALPGQGNCEGSGLAVKGGEHGLGWYRKELKRGNTGGLSRYLLFSEWPLSSLWPLGLSLSPVAMSFLLEGPVDARPAP